MSGGPAMTVSSVYAETADVLCVWFDGRKCERMVFPLHILVSAQPDLSLQIQPKAAFDLLWAPYSVKFEDRAAPQLDGA